MNAQSPTISDLLHNVTRSIDLDLAVTVADVINLYTAAIKRNANRSVLGPDDAIRILTIITHIQQGCSGDPDPELLPGKPVRQEPPQ